MKKKKGFSVEIFTRQISEIKVSSVVNSIIQMIIPGFDHCTMTV